MKNRIFVLAPAILVVLLFASSCKEKPKQPDIHRAAALSDIESIEILIENDPELTHKLDESGMTPLITAVFWGKLNSARKLINLGADVNERGENQDTPLIWACIKGNKPMARLLIQQGADVNAKNSKGMTCMHFVVEHEDRGLVDLLLKNGARINAKDNDGVTPLFMVVALRKDEDFMMYLIDRGADIYMVEEVLRREGFME